MRPKARSWRSTRFKLLLTAVVAIPVSVEPVSGQRRPVDSDASFPGARATDYHLARGGFAFAAPQPKGPLMTLDPERSPVAGAFLGWTLGVAGGIAVAWASEPNPEGEALVYLMSVGIGSILGAAIGAEAYAPSRRSFGSRLFIEGLATVVGLAAVGVVGAPAGFILVPVAQIGSMAF